jgi:hypothetical protein
MKLEIGRRIGELARQGASSVDWEAVCAELPGSQRKVVANFLGELERDGVPIPSVLDVDGGPKGVRVSCPDWHADLSYPYEPPPEDSIFHFDWKADFDRLDALDIEAAKLRIRMAQMDLRREMAGRGDYDYEPPPLLPFLPFLPSPDARPDPAPPAPAQPYTGGRVPTGSPYFWMSGGHLGSIDRKLGGAVYGYPGYGLAVLWDYTWPVVKGVMSATLAGSIALGLVLWAVAWPLCIFMWEFSAFFARLAIILMTMGLFDPGGRGRRRRR